jgi:hypothetical protein
VCGRWDSSAARPPILASLPVRIAHRCSHRLQLPLYSLSPLTTHGHCLPLLPPPCLGHAGVVDRVRDVGRAVGVRLRLLAPQAVPAGAALPLAPQHFRAAAGVGAGAGRRGERDHFGGGGAGASARAGHHLGGRLAALDQEEQGGQQGDAQAAQGVGGVCQEHGGRGPGDLPRGRLHDPQHLHQAGGRGGRRRRRRRRARARGRGATTAARSRRAAAAAARRRRRSASGSTGRRAATSSPPSPCGWC